MTQNPIYVYDKFREIALNSPRERVPDDVESLASRHQRSTLRLVYNRALQRVDELHSDITSGTIQPTIEAYRELGGLSYVIGAIDRRLHPKRGISQESF